MALNTRIYVVQGKDATIAERLVRTHHPSRAVEHVSSAMFEARVASQEDIVRLMELGVRVEDPNAGEAPVSGSDQAPAPQSDSLPAGN